MFVCDSVCCAWMELNQITKRIICNNKNAVIQDVEPDLVHWLSDLTGGKNLNQSKLRIVRLCLRFSNLLFQFCADYFSYSFQMTN